MWRIEEGIFQLQGTEQGNPKEEAFEMGFKEWGEVFHREQNEWNESVNFGAFCREANCSVYPEFSTQVQRQAVFDPRSWRTLNATLTPDHKESSISF